VTVKREEARTVALRDQMPLQANNKEIKVSLDDPSVNPDEIKQDGTLIWKLPLNPGEKNGGLPIKPAPRVFSRQEKIIGERSAVVPHPAVFGTQQRGMVCVRRCGERESAGRCPSVSGSLFQNMGRAAISAVGLVDDPKSISANVTGKWEECFFSSNFARPMSIEA